jgi:hypothetical protein
MNAPGRHHLWRLCLDSPRCDAVMIPSAFGNRGKIDDRGAPSPV